VWIDTDVIINNQEAPDIAAYVPVEKVGAVEAYSIPTKEIQKLALLRQYDNWKKSGISYIDNITPGSYYENRGIAGKYLDSVVQTGVLICSQSKHQEIFEYIYNSYEETSGAEWNYEMPAMSYELIKNNFVHWIPSQFNFCVATLIAAFYPFIFNGRKSNSIIYQAIHAAMSKYLLNDQNNHQMLALLNIFDLSVPIGDG